VSKFWRLLKLEFLLAWRVSRLSDSDSLVFYGTGAAIGLGLLLGFRNLIQIPGGFALVWQNAATDGPSRQLLVAGLILLSIMGGLWGSSRAMALVQPTKLIDQLSASPVSARVVFAARMAWSMMFQLVPLVFGLALFMLVVGARVGQALVTVLVSSGVFAISNMLGSLVALLALRSFKTRVVANAMQLIFTIMTLGLIAGYLMIASTDALKNWIDFPLWQGLASPSGWLGQLATAGSLERFSGVPWVWLAVIVVALALLEIGCLGYSKALRRTAAEPTGRVKPHALRFESRLLLAVLRKEWRAFVRERWVWPQLISSTVVTAAIAFFMTYRILTLESSRFWSTGALLTLTLVFSGFASTLARVFVKGESRPELVLPAPRALIGLNRLKVLAAALMGLIVGLPFALLLLVFGFKAMLIGGLSIGLGVVLSAPCVLLSPNLGARGAVGATLDAGTFAALGAMIIASVPIFAWLP
jgi:hypothetical protein